MQKDDYNSIDLDFKDSIQELINIGLGKAAKVISELADSYVTLGVINLYPSKAIPQLPVFSSYVVVQEVSGNILNGKTVFSMIDDELIKLLKHLELIDSDYDHLGIQNLDLILDAYQEIGNIILGNIISSIVDYIDERVEIKLPYLSDKKIFDAKDETTYIIVEISFTIDKLNANGNLCLINDLSSYEQLAQKLINQE